MEVGITECQKVLFFGKQKGKNTFKRLKKKKKNCKLGWLVRLAFVYSEEYLLRLGAHSWSSPLLVYWDIKASREVM